MENLTGSEKQIKWAASIKKEAEKEMERVNNLNELMVAAALAMEQRDPGKLEDLLKLSDDWLQDEESRTAQRTLLESMVSACWELVEFELEFEWAKNEETT